jgi:membrane-associated phospholipid phosphatase
VSEDRASARPAGLRRQILVALLLAGAVVACHRFVDRPLAVWAHGLAPGVVSVFRKITAFGSSGPYLGGLAVAYPILRLGLRRQLAAQRALYVFSAIALSGILADALKLAFGRWRPIALFEDGPRYGFAFFEYGYRHNSFPSGHATTAGALACALTVLYPRWWGLWSGAAALIAASRVVVGAHFPGDVLAGLALGAVFALWLARTAWFRDIGPTARGAARLTSTPPEW